MQFVLTAQKASVSDISLEINNYKKISMPIRLQKGHRVQYKGGQELWVLDAQWNRLKSYKLSPADLIVKTGDNSLNIDCKFDTPKKEATLKLEIKTLGKSEMIALPKI